MFDILTYVLARKKASSQLETQIEKITKLTEEAEANAQLSEELYSKTQAAAQQAAASASATSYALGADIDGRLSFFEKVETETTETDNSN